MSRPVSVGLGGDGDECDAIEAIEKDFGVSLNYNDASEWATAGSVWESLQATGASSVKSPGAWDRFRSILCDETGVDWRKIEPDSPLLGYPLSAEFKYYWKRITNNA
ncbi:hypothetical protein [Parasphingorhabdus marina]|uniref:hypothetical protein n=1 Tax=Parasphingorhabdus marina TaxID=394732 RepID=UPI0009417407|nr:hypothetical protein [Parasphingorhabdus marina]